MTSPAEQTTTYICEKEAANAAKCNDVNGTKGAQSLTHLEFSRVGLDFVFVQLKVRICRGLTQQVVGGRGATAGHEGELYEW